LKLTELKGVGAKRAHALSCAGIETLADLLEYFPRDHDDRSKVKTIAELTPEAVNTIRGVVAVEPESVKLSSITITKLKIKDHSGVLEILWFNQPYLKKNFKRGTEYIFTGKVRETGAVLQMISPDYEPSGEVELTGGRIVPLYTVPGGFSQKTFRALVFQALNLVENIDPPIEVFMEFLPAQVLSFFNLCDRKTAVKNIHFPESDEMFLKARRRLVFEELFFAQLMMATLKKSMKSRTGIVFEDINAQSFIKSFPFIPTEAQLRVLNEISQDFLSGVRMNRLVQGDVGSGKTAIAMCAAFIAAKNGYQTAFMVPTEVLANQHYLQCLKYFQPHGFDVVLLTGGIGAKTGREALEKIANGRASVIVGTHALIQERVAYHRLGLCITDEQHRFGVNQRLALAHKGDSSQFVPPHVLVMTATPIPRTLGLILYGDSDISVVDQLPPGRVEIKTYSVNSQYRERINNFIRKETARNHQVYVVCPAIEQPEEPDEPHKPHRPHKTTRPGDVLSYTCELSALMPDVKIAALHGRMKPAEKQEIMDSFKAGEIQVIVSTTVIEVGIHVENATLMIIENAERFGLSQLHQLRGRVGRGAAQSYCVLITDSKNEHTNARMKAMCETTDGFRLAELDLKLRGAGDFFGTRQHGLPSFAIANLYQDINILEEAQVAVQNLSNIQLSPEETEMLHRRVSLFRKEILL